MISFSIDSYAAPFPKKKDNSTRLLFTIRVESATLSHINGLSYQLTIPRKAVHSILAFSDRPVRQAFQWTPDSYSKFTQSNAKNSFKNNPPNMTLSFYPKPFDGVFEVLSAKTEGAKITLALRYIPAKMAKGAPKLAPPNQYHGSMLMFIDSANSVCVAASFENGLIGARFASVSPIIRLFVLPAIYAVFCAMEGNPSSGD